MDKGRCNSHLRKLRCECTSGSFASLTHKQEVKNKYEKRAQLKNRIPSSRIVYILLIIFIIYYALALHAVQKHNIMGENNNNIYIYISPLIITYFYIKIKLNKKKRDSAS